MPKNPWSAKRQRQYSHIKDSLVERGRDEPVAEEIAARIVNKERAQHGESTVASGSSIHDMSAGRRGGLRRDGICRVRCACGIGAAGARGLSAAAGEGDENAEKRNGRAGAERAHEVIS